MNPLVSVICVCYNHARFVVEALESVKNQTYSNIELIIVDDGSSDNSALVIHEWLKQYPETAFLDLKENIGYTKAFNKAFRLAKGEFYIDLAADDVLLPNRIEKGVQGFLEKGARYAIQFSDAHFIDVNGKPMGKHSDKFPHSSIPQGDVYVEVIQRYFICSPTMLVRKSALDALGGYDENLAYEDFDLWVRLARQHHFFYLPEVLLLKRKVPGSLGQRQYAFRSKQMESTFGICKKIKEMNRSGAERKALKRRVLYELRQCLLFLNWPLASRYIGLWLSI